MSWAVLPVLSSSTSYRPAAGTARLAGEKPRSKAVTFNVPVDGSAAAAGAAGAAGADETAATFATGFVLGAHVQVGRAPLEQAAVATASNAVAARRRRVRSMSGSLR